MKKRYTAHEMLEMLKKGDLKYRQKIRADITYQDFFYGTITDHRLFIVMDKRLYSLTLLGKYRYFNLKKLIKSPDFLGAYFELL